MRISRFPFLLAANIAAFGALQRSNPALNLAPSGRWTLRDKAAQRRLALRWATSHASV
jgi:hypothetical protein